MERKIGRLHAPVGIRIRPSPVYLCTYYKPMCITKCHSSASVLRLQKWEHMGRTHAFVTWANYSPPPRGGPSNRLLWLRCALDSRALLHGWSCRNYIFPTIVPSHPLTFKPPPFRIVGGRVGGYIAPTIRLTGAVGRKIKQAKVSISSIDPSQTCILPNDRMEYQ